MAETATNPPGRNEPCHCGSGKKYKRCCRSRDEEARREAHAEAAAEAAEAPPAESGDGAAPTAPDPRRTVDQSWRRSAQTRQAFQPAMAPRRRGDR